MDDVEFVLPTAGHRPRKLVPKFEDIVKPDPEASAREGRIVCKVREQVTIPIPGQTKSIHAEWVNDKIRAEYAEEYAHWKATKKQMVVGTPLNHYPKFTPTRVMELNLSGVLTLEQFVDLSDADMQKCGMGVRKEIAEVKAWMAAAKDTALVTRQAAENLALTERCKDLERQIKELADRFDTKKKPTLGLVKNDVS